MSAIVKIRRLSETARIPSQGSEYAAGYDIYADLTNPVQILPHETVKISSGIAAEIPKEYWLGIFARSGLATKQGLRPANCVGVVDPDYRGAIIVAVHNDSEETRIINPEDRIGQIVLLPRTQILFDEVDELTGTDRDAAGFGSTGN